MAICFGDIKDALWDQRISKNMEEQSGEIKNFIKRELLMKNCSGSRNGVPTPRGIFYWSFLC